MLTILISQYSSVQHLHIFCVWHCVFMHREWIFFKENYFKFNLLCPEESHCTWFRTVLIPFNILSAFLKFETFFLRDYLCISFTELVSTNDSSFNEQKKVEKCKNNSNFNDISLLYWFYEINEVLVTVVLANCENIINLPIQSFFKFIDIACIARLSLQMCNNATQAIRTRWFTISLT